MTKDMHVVEYYTGAWQEALSPRSEVSLGDEVRLPANSSPDGREWDDFSRALRRAGARIDYVESDAEYDVYQVVREEEA